MNKIKISYTGKDDLLKKRIKASIEKKKLINEYIREGKDLSELHEKGIKFNTPL